MKKIVYIGNNLAAATKYTPMLLTLSELLKVEGYTMVVASSKMNKLHRLFDMAFTLLKHRKDTDYVLIDTFGATNFYFAVLISQLARVLSLKYIPILRGGNLPDRFENNPTLSKLIFSHSYVNVTPSHFLKVELKNKGYTATVIPNIIKIANYKYEPRKIVGPKLLYVRAFHQIYNPTMAVRVLHLVQQKYPEATLCMIGPEKDASFQETKDLALKLGLEKSIQYTGVLSKEAWHKMSEDYDVFINTTTIDNTPVSVMEAMAMGLPVVSTNVGGIPYLLEDGKDAYLVASNDAEAMSAKILELIEGKANAKEVIVNARKKVEQFDWSMVSYKWRCILDKASKPKLNLYNVILERIILPLGDIVFGLNYIDSLKSSRKYNLLSEQEIIILQKQKLIELLKYATENSKHYKDIDLEGLDPLNWLKQFPIIDKTMLKENVDAIITSQPSKLIKFSSSGSSGIQSTVFMSKNEVSNLKGILTNWWEWAGYKVGDPIIQTGITPVRGFQKKIKDFFFRTTYFNAFNISEEQVLNVLKRVKKKKKKHFLIGYASSLNFFAEVALKNNIDISFKAVISLGDKLFTHYRGNLEKAFKCKVFNTYGSSEGFLIASQYDLRYLYIYSPQVYLEILDDENNPVKDGEMGNIIVTRLDGFSMPLIRYKLGDLGIKLPKENYPKDRGFNYPLLQEIIGRDTDVVKTKRKEILIVHFFTGIFEHYPEIKQFKVIQKKLDGLLIKIIREENFNIKILKEVEKLIREKINDKNFKIDFEFVSYIPPTKSGKPQIIESFLKNG